jgi:glutamate dehydrogenase (NAD(P)+)
MTLPEERKLIGGADLSRIGRLLNLSSIEEKLLEKDEKQTIIDLRAKLDDKTVILADAYLVYHNTARGPAKGGIRLASNVTLDETRDLAERMTWKTALTKIPFGGGKSGITVDPRRMSAFTKKLVIRRFVHEIRLELTSGSYIPAPDLGSGPPEMAAIYGELHMQECVTGKPPRVGGLPGREEATGYGVSAATIYALEKLRNKEVKDSTVAVQGFGNVGSWTCNFLSEKGAKIVAVTDVDGGVFKADGLDIRALRKHVEENGTVNGFNGKVITNEELLGLDVDVLIPAAVEKVIDRETAHRVRANIVVEGANGPTTAEGDAILRKNGLIVVPDILANSGGVVASYVEWRSGKSGSITPRQEVYDTIRETIVDTFDRVVETSERMNLSYRDASMVLAVDEVIKAMHDRGWV